MSSGDVYGFARVAHRYQGSYYWSVDPEDVEKLHYSNVLRQLLISIPNDPIAFAVWKAARIGRIQEMKIYCNQDDDMIDEAGDEIPLSDIHSRAKRLHPAEIRRRKWLRMVANSLYRPTMFDQPYRLSRAELERNLWNNSSDSQVDSYIFELDLDNMCFLLHGYPLFKLQPAMPSLSLVYRLHATRRTNSYGHPFSFGGAIPDQYRFDIFVDIPTQPVDDNNAGLRTYVRHTPITVIEAHTLLSVREHRSNTEITSAAIRSTLVGILLKLHGPEILRHIVLAGNQRTLCSKERQLALSLVATALSPSHAYSKVCPSRWTVAIDEANSWWPRKHICVILASQLHVERNCQSAVGKTVNCILQRISAPGIVFGVAFSVLHCVLIRVSKDPAGAISISRTEVFQFLPDFCGNSPITPGIVALCRLGCMPASDDVQFFHSMLRSIRYAIPTTRQLTGSKAADAGMGCAATHPGNNQEPPSASTVAHHRISIFQLPVEVILNIAEYLCHPRDLNAFAVSCTALMAACLPFIRLPQVLDIVCFSQRSQRRDEDFDTGLAPSVAGFILREFRPIKRSYEGNEDVIDALFTSEYWSMHEGHEVAVAIGLSESLCIDRTDRMPSDAQILESISRMGSMVVHYGDAVDKTYFERRNVNITLCFSAFYSKRDSLVTNYL